jgi:3-keto-disaccharide hydrolase
MFRLLLSSSFTLALLTSSPAADDKTIELFNGKDLTGWKHKDEKKRKWSPMQVIVTDKEPTVFSKPEKLTDRYDLVNPEGRGTDLFTVEKYGDIHLELEFMVPKGSNSGIYLMGEYEVQILDSYGKPDEKLGQGDLGALYSAAAPKKNASKKPGEWQKFTIDFQAPKFEGDKKVANAKFIKVVLNDVVLHENVEMKQHTPGGLTGKEAATGPLMFQGDHGPVAFRNIKITPRK